MKIGQSQTTTTSFNLHKKNVSIQRDAFFLLFVSDHVLWNNTIIELTLQRTSFDFFFRVKKKLNKLASEKGFGLVALWIKSIINHLHWVAVRPREMPERPRQCGQAYSSTYATNIMARRIRSAGTQYRFRTMTKNGSEKVRTFLCHKVLFSSLRY